MRRVAVITGGNRDIGVATARGRARASSGGAGCLAYRAVTVRPGLIETASLRSHSMLAAHSSGLATRASSVTGAIVRGSGGK